MKKLMFSFVLVVLSSSASAIMPEGSFKGGGVWKAFNNTKGTWTETMVIKADGKNFDAANSLQVLKDGVVIHEEKNSVRYDFNADGTYTMKSGAKNVGVGYCFDMTCHSEMTEGEETVHISGNTIHKMGSLPEGTVKLGTMYSGKLDKVK